MVVHRWATCEGRFVKKQAGERGGCKKDLFVCVRCVYMFLNKCQLPYNPASHEK